MKSTRIQHSAEFKAKVAIETLRGSQWLAELPQRYKLHPQQIATWKQEIIEKSVMVFERKTSKPESTEADQ